MSNENENDVGTFDCQGCGQSSDYSECEECDDGQLVCPECGCTPDNF